jgi:hypothetical protein
MGCKPPHTAANTPKMLCPSQIGFSLLTPQAVKEAPSPQHTASCCALTPSVTDSTQTASACATPYDHSTNFTSS